MKENFVEVLSVLDANNVDPDSYSFVGLRENRYVFKKRKGVK